MSDIKQVLHDIERCSFLPDACGDCSKFTVNRNRCMEELMAEAYALLKDPDRIKVTRCKDCKHLFDGEQTENCCDVLMEKTGWMHEISVSPDWYCADGERR